MHCSTWPVVQSVSATNSRQMRGIETPPRDDEFELSLFGPGVGESVAIHLGYGDWAIVDSCRNPHTRAAAAMTYLDALAVPLERAIKLIVLTHWHDDHIRGASDILERATSAKLVCSSKWDDPALYEAMATAIESNVDATGFDEMSRMFRILHERRLPDQRIGSTGPVWAAEGMVLFNRASAEDRGQHPAEVVALSPSPGTQALSLHALSDFLPRVGAPQRRAVRVSPNQSSVVVQVRAGNRSALLGADLEQSSNPAVGWEAVVRSTVRPEARSEIFKVPHHGSSNAHNEKVWSTMLTPDPVACLTPFSKGVRPLPGTDDVERLLRHTSRAYCTRAPQSGRPRKRSPAVQRTIRETTRRHRVVEGRWGQVRVRGRLCGTSPLDVELHGAAYRVKHR